MKRRAKIAHNGERDALGKKEEIVKEKGDWDVYRDER